MVISRILRVDALIIFAPALVRMALAVLRSILGVRCRIPLLLVVRIVCLHVVLVSRGSSRRIASALVSARQQVQVEGVFGAELGEVELTQCTTCFFSGGCYPAVVLARALGRAAASARA